MDVDTMFTLVLIGQSLFVGGSIYFGFFRGEWTKAIFFLLFAVWLRP